MFADVLLPLPLENLYTYSIPSEWIEAASFGKRVEVQFGPRKKYAGIIISVHRSEPGYKTKQILSVLDNHPVITEEQFNFWKWIAEYYVCTIGEVMAASLPVAYQLSSETEISISDVNEDILPDLSTSALRVYDVLVDRKKGTLEELQKITGIKTLYPHIVSLYQAGLIHVSEKLEQRYTPKVVKTLRLGENYWDENGMQDALSKVKAEKQIKALLAFLTLSGTKDIAVDRDDVIKQADVTVAVIAALVKKGIFLDEVREINRMDAYAKAASSKLPDLTSDQRNAVSEIENIWKDKNVALLHGVTGSGKTLIYFDLIQRALQAGEQILFLVPEIGLSTQILQRLQAVFGEQVTINHSRLTPKERVDVWQQVMTGIPLVAGVRSSIFLPFQHIKLIIVDEEHDASYKQQDPSPRYNARDMALVLAQRYGAKVLLGSATPAVESYHSASTGKYGLVKLNTRFGELSLPAVTIIDRRKDKSYAGAMYSHSLIEKIKEITNQKKQVILFKNRRGYAPVLTCTNCSWTSTCTQCDISLTYHKFKHVLTCHICGRSQSIIDTCPACGSPALSLEGAGTEKIQDELQEAFPQLKIARLDQDTTRTKNAFADLIDDFEKGKVQILVGTQMVTKGLDFDNVGLVGVLDADQALHFPDFRAEERAYQSMEQVSGRAGRKNEEGIVIIQTYQPDHPVFKDVIKHNYDAFYNRAIEERKQFNYPPFSRQIQIDIRHTIPQLSEEAAKLIVMELTSKFGGDRIYGPTIPSISRIRNQYIHLVFIKFEKDARLGVSIKNAVRELIHEFGKKHRLSGLRIRVDVDPV